MNQRKGEDILSGVRIGIDVRPALRATTGVGRYLLGLVPAVLARGESVLAFSSSLRDRLDPEPFAPATVVDRRIPVRLLNRLWNRAGWPSFERLAGAVDVVHSPTPLPIPTRRAARVVTLHDLYFLRHPETVVREMRRDWVPLLRRSLASADAVVAVSEWTRNEALRLLDLDPRRVIVARHGLEPRWWQRPAPETRALTLSRLGLDAPYLLAVGSLEVRKNYPRLLAAFARLRRAGHASLRLVIAGPDGPDGGALAATAARLGLGSALVLAGYCHDGELQALYSGARALVMPSLEEGFGFPVLEAMAAGCPVVAASAGALPEVAGTAAIYANPEDEEELERALARACDDDPLRATLIAAGEARAHTFRWDSSAERHLEAWGRAREARA